MSTVIENGSISPAESSFTTSTESCSLNIWLTWDNHIYIDLSPLIIGGDLSLYIYTNKVLHYSIMLRNVTNH